MKSNISLRDNKIVEMHNNKINGPELSKICKKKKCVEFLNYLYKDNLRSLKRKESKFETIRNQFYTKLQKRSHTE